MKIGDRVRWRNPALAAMGVGEIMATRKGGYVSVRFENYKEYRSETDRHTSHEGDFILTKSYESIGADIGKLVSTKQAVYGNSFGRAGGILRELFPDGIKPEQYDEVLTIAWVLDKLFRIATDRDALGEDPWRDIAGYALLAVERRQSK